MALNYQALIANYVSLALIALSGIVCNVLIIRSFGAESLAAFNFGFAVFVIASQLSCFGVHQSCLRCISIADGDAVPPLFTSGLLLATLTSAAVTCLLLLAVPFLEYIFSAINFDGEIEIIAIAIFFYSINKVCMFTLNALRKMKTYALMQTLRSLLLLVFIAVVCTTKNDDVPLVGAFLLAELVLTVGFLSMFSDKLRRLNMAKLKPLLATHYYYGRDVLMTGLSTEVNTRVDVLTLSAFTNELVVGVYSFIAMVIEGFYQLIVVVKNVINPDLAKMLSENEIERLSDFCAMLFKGVMSAIGFAAMSLVILFPGIVDVFGLGYDILNADYILYVLLFCLFLASGWLPFDQAVSLGGFPRANSRIYIIVTLVNILINLALVPVIGMLGAAVGTGASWLCLAWLIEANCRKLYNLRLNPFVR